MLTALELKFHFIFNMDLYHIFILFSFFFSEIEDYAHTHTHEKSSIPQNTRYGDKSWTKKEQSGL
jgi:hypothetical protein